MVEEDNVIHVKNVESMIGEREMGEVIYENCKNFVVCPYTYVCKRR